jgi:hypothetical protein
MTRICTRIIRGFFYGKNAGLWALYAVLGWMPMSKSLWAQ